MSGRFLPSTFQESSPLLPILHPTLPGKKEKKSKTNKKTLHAIIPASPKGPPRPSWQASRNLSRHREDTLETARGCRDPHIRIPRGELQRLHRFSCNYSPQASSSSKIRKNQPTKAPKTWGPPHSDSSLQTIAIVLIVTSIGAIHKGGLPRGLLRGLPRRVGHQGGVLDLHRVPPNGGESNACCALHTEHTSRRVEIGSRAVSASTSGPLRRAINHLVGKPTALTLRSVRRAGPPSHRARCRMLRWRPCRRAFSWRDGRRC